MREVNASIIQGSGVGPALYVVNAADLHTVTPGSPQSGYYYYAALLPRRGPHIASHSVRPSVCPSVCLSVCPSVPLSCVTSRHLANYNDTHVPFCTRRGPHIVRPSRPHKFLLACANRVLSASRRQPHLLRVSAVDRRQTWSMDKSV